MYSFPYQGFNGPLIFVIIISVHGVMRNKRYYIEGLYNAVWLYRC